MPVGPTGSAAKRMYTWTFPGAPVQIRIGIDLVGQIEREIWGMLGAGSGQELWGILLGNVQSSAVVEIQAYRSLESPWNAATPIRWERALAECQSRTDGLSVVGYYRTDQDHSIRLRDDDVTLIQEYFPEQNSVFLVIDAAASGQTSTAGFFFSDKGQVHSAFSFLEFPFDAHQLRMRAERQQPAIASTETTPTPISRMQTPLQEEMQNRVVSKSGRAEFFEVRLPGHPLPVRVAYAAIHDLRAALEENSERLGILLGSVSRQTLLIQHFELLPQSKEALYDPEATQAALREWLQDRLKDTPAGAPSVVGFFRTQMGGRLAMTESDHSLAKWYPPASGAVFMLIQTAAHRPWSAALFSLDSEVASRVPAPEFPFDEYLLRNRRLTDVMRPSEPRPPLVPVWSRKTGWMAVGLIAAILAVAGLAYNWPHSADRTERQAPGALTTGALGLKVNRSGNDFEVTWDRSSSAVRRALGGTLTIRDGVTRALPLDKRQLEEGRILYSPLLGDLDFRLEIATDDHRTQAESIQVLAWNARPPSELSSILTQDADRTSGVHPPSIGNPEVRPQPPFAGAAPQRANPALNNRKDSIGASAHAIDPRALPVANTVINESGSKPGNVPATVIAPPEPVATSQEHLRAPQEPPKAPPEPPKPVAETAKAVERPEPNSAPRLPDPSPPPSREATAPLALSTPPPAEQARNQRAPASGSSDTVTPPVSASTSIAANPPSARIAERTLAPSSVPPVPIRESNPAITPEISELLRRAGPNGGFIVSVRVAVDASGNVKDAELVSSAGGTQVASFPIKSAAVRAARLWKFRPGTLNGNPVAAEYTIQFQFK